MARAWEQVGDVEAANAALRRLQASRAVSASLHERHLSALSAGRLVLGRAPAPRAGRPAGHGHRRDGRSRRARRGAASALPAGSTWRGVAIDAAPGQPARRQRRGQRRARVVVAGLLGGIAEPDVLPDGTVALAPPSTVVGAAGTALLDDRLAPPRPPPDSRSRPAGRTPRR